MTLTQIAYLSIQPEAMARSRTYVQAFMPWITRTLVVTPEHLADEMRALGDDVTVLTDQEVLPRGTDARQLDHVTLNFRLRVGMALSGALDDVFLMSDDDYRPLKPITPDRFVVPGPEGRDQLIGYSFYDIKNWTAENTPFDQGQQNVLAVASYLGATSRAYASHQPQAIDRELFVEAAGICHRVAPTAPVDEWGVHYNIGRWLDPGRFTPARPYVVLGWPELPNLWRRAVVPDEYAFENFYGRLYEPGGLYDGLATSYDPETHEVETVEKIRRWRRLDLQTRRLERPAVTYPYRESAETFAELRQKKRELDWLMLQSRAAGYEDPTFEPF